MASAVARVYNGGLGTELPAVSRGKAGRGDRGLIWMSNGSRKFAHVPKIKKRKKIRHLCNLCQKIGKKSWLVRKLRGEEAIAKQGASIPCTPARALTATRSHWFHVSVVDAVLYRLLQK